MNFVVVVCEKLSKNRTKWDYSVLPHKSAFLILLYFLWDRDQTPVSQHSVIFYLYFFYNLISTQHLTVLIRGVILHLEQMRRSCAGAHDKRKQCTYSLQMFLQNID